MLTICLILCHSCLFVFLFERVVRTLVQDVLKLFLTYKINDFQTVLPGNVDFVMKETWHGVAGLPKWNKNINYASTIASPTDNFDIITVKVRPFHLDFQAFSMEIMMCS